MDKAPLHPVPEGFVIRPATPADGPAVLELFARHLAALGFAPDPVLDADMAQFPSAYAAPGDLFFVAAAPGGGIAAMAGLRAGEIRRVHVRPEFRNRGLGRALVAGLARRAAEARQPRIHAFVAPANTASRRMFAACGFQVAAAKTGAGGECDLFEYAGCIH